MVQYLGRYVGILTEKSENVRRGKKMKLSGELLKKIGEATKEVVINTINKI